MSDAIDLTGDGGVLKTIVRRAKPDAIAPSENLPLVDGTFTSTKLLKFIYPPCFKSCNEPFLFFYYVPVLLKICSWVALYHSYCIMKADSCYTFDCRFTCRADVEAFSWKST